MQCGNTAVIWQRYRHQRYQWLRLPMSDTRWTILQYFFHFFFFRFLLFYFKFFSFCCSFFLSLFSFFLCLLLYQSSFLLLNDVWSDGSSLLFRYFLYIRWVRSISIFLLLFCRFLVFYYFFRFIFLYFNIFFFFFHWCFHTFRQQERLCIGKVLDVLNEDWKRLVLLSAKMVLRA